MKHTSLNYVDALRVFKSTLSGGSERTIIAKELQRFCQNRGEVAALDIGTGDGSFIAKVLRDVKNKRIATTGLDPSPIAISAFRSNMSGHLGVQSKFEDLPFTRMFKSFDVVLSIQSLYYINHPRLSLARILKMTRQDGLVIASLWSHNCVLYLLHKSVFGGRPGSGSALTAETVQRWLGADHPHYNVASVDFEGFVDFEAWRRNELIFDSALIVLSREWADRMKPAESERVKLRSFLEKQKSFEKRINRVLLITHKAV